MAGGGTNNNSVLVPKSVSDSTEDEEMAGDNMTDGVANKDGPTLVLKSVSDSTAINDDKARLKIKIVNAQHLTNTSTGVALELAQEDMLQLQQLLKKNKETMTAGGDMAGGESTKNNDDMAIDLTGGDLTSKDPADPVKTLGFCEIGGCNTVDLLNKNHQQLKDNTAANVASFLQAAALNKVVIPVWKLSQHKHRSSSSAAIARTVWKRIKAFKDVSEIISASTKFQKLWANFNIKKYSSTIPVPTIMAFISVLNNKKEE